MISLNLKMAKKQRHSLFTVLDIGSTKIVCFIGKITAHKQIEIIGIGHHISQGIKAGRITDLKAAESSIAQAVEAAEKMVSVSSNNLISQCMSSDLMVTGHEINDKDLNRLLFQLIDKFNDQELEVIHSFAYDYIIDGNRGIDNPLGLYGNNLSAEFNIVSTPRTYLINLSSCMAHCQLEVENFVSAAYASGLACLTNDEMNLGVTLIEFGGGATSISVFNKGQMLYTDAIPIGGMHVTNDIARGLATDFASAERVKTLYGTSILTSADNNDIFEVPISSNSQDTEMNVVQRSMLVEIIRARIEEILEILYKKLEASGMQRFSGNKIIITGGASQLAGMKEIVGHVFSKTVRIGYPKTLPGLADSTSGIAFATPIGMMLHVLEYENNIVFSHPLPANDSGIISSITQWFKENFG
jgi:cell division protein FtsA